MASIPFRPSHMIVLSELPDSEKQKYYEALLDNDCKLFTVAGEGARVADVRILAPGVKKAMADLVLSSSLADWRCLRSSLALQ